MTLMEHLYELRHRMFLAVLAMFLGTVVGFIWFSVDIPAIRLRSLGDILTGPYCAVPSPPRLSLGGTGEGDCTLLATSAFSALQLRLTSGLLAGVLLTCPIWLYQLWAFVGPALHDKEKKYALSFTGIGAALFAGGMMLAYLIIPEALKVLLAFGGDFVVAGLDPEKYYRFLIGMMLIFGVSLELPLLLVMLNFAGVIKGAKMAKVRRYAYFGLIVFSGIAVPGNDPISMGVLALTLCLLYEVAVQVAKAHDRRTGRRADTDLSELPDDQASPLGMATDPSLALDDDGVPAETASVDGAVGAEPIGAPGAVGQAESSARPPHDDGPDTGGYRHFDDVT